jgi:hypothetical protein
MAADRNVVVGVAATVEEPVELAREKLRVEICKALPEKLIVSQLLNIFPGNLRNSKIH